MVTGIHPTPGGKINSSGRSRRGAVLRLPPSSPDPATLILFSGHLHPASTGHPGRKARMLYPPAGGELPEEMGLLKMPRLHLGVIARGFLCNVAF